MSEQFQFDTVINRRGTNSYKWDTTPEGILPMWVADMDFKTAPCIIEALKQRVEQGVFGYTKVPDEYYTATVDWFAKRHGWTFKASDIIYTIGVVPAISAILKALTHKNDKVIVQTPSYNCFFSSIRNTGCQLLANKLVYSPDGYTIDFDDLEQCAADPDAKVLILCNPHNPVGRVWSRDELMRIADICLRNHVTVIADEIHCELTYDGHNYTPFASLSEDVAKNTVSCVSPSKAFNIAGLQIANIVCADPLKRMQIDWAINENEVCDVNPFGVIATIEAYCHGSEWLDALRDYIWHNYEYLRDFFSEELPEYPIVPLEGTYLAWVNIQASGMTGAELEDYLIKKAFVRLNEGSMYGDGGEDFLRINLACPRSVLQEVMPKIASALKAL